MWDQEASQILVGFQCVPREYRSELGTLEVENGTWLDVRTAAEHPQWRDMNPSECGHHLQHCDLLGVTLRL